MYTKPPKLNKLCGTLLIIRFIIIITIAIPSLRLQGAAPNAETQNESNEGHGSEYVKGHEHAVWLNLGAEGE